MLWKNAEHYHKKTIGTRKPEFVGRIILEIERSFKSFTLYLSFRSIAASSDIFIL